MVSAHSWEGGRESTYGLKRGLERYFSLSKEMPSSWLRV